MYINILDSGRGSATVGVANEVLFSSCELGPDEWAGS